MVEEIKHYLSKNGLKEIEELLDSLNVERLVKIKECSSLVSHPNVIESESFLFRQEIAQIEKKIREIEQVLENYELIKMPSKKNRDIVFIGATIVVEVDGELDEFSLVDKLETNPSLGRISSECLVGRMLLGKKIGDIVKVQSAVETIYKIIKVEYREI